MSVSNETAVWESLVAQVDRYLRPGGLSGELIDEEFRRATGAPSIEALCDLAIRAAKALIPTSERTAERVTTVANAWMIGATARGNVEG